MIPFGDNWDSSYRKQLWNASYEDIMGFIRKGFSVKFPMGIKVQEHPCSEGINLCLKNSTR